MVIETLCGSFDSNLFCSRAWYACCVHLPVVSMLMLHREQAVAGGGEGGGGYFSDNWIW